MSADVVVMLRCDGVSGTGCSGCCPPHLAVNAELARRAARAVGWRTGIPTLTPQTATKPAAASRMDLCPHCREGHDGLQELGVAGAELAAVAANLAGPWSPK